MKEAAMPAAVPVPEQAIDVIVPHTAGEAPRDGAASSSAGIAQPYDVFKPAHTRDKLWSKVSPAVVSGIFAVSGVLDINNLKNPTIDVKNMAVATVAGTAIITHAVRRTLQKRHQAQVGELVGERLELAQVEGKALIRWHPTPGEDEEEGMRRVVAWAMHSKGIDSLSLPAAVVHRHVPESVQGTRVESWATAYLRSHPEIQRWKGLRATPADEVFSAPPKWWADQLRAAEFGAQPEMAKKPALDTLVAKLRELKPDDPLIDVYDAYTNDRQLQRERMASALHGTMMKRLSRIERVRAADPTLYPTLPSRVAMLGGIDKNNPLTVVWSDPQQGPRPQPLADVLEIPQANRDLQAFIKGMDKLPFNELVDGLEFHLYAAVRSKEELMDESIVPQPQELAMPRKGGNKPAFVADKELTYSTAPMRRRQRTAVMLTALVCGVGTFTALHAWQGSSGLGTPGGEVSLLGGGSGAPGMLPDYIDWQLAGHNLSTKGYWAQTTSDSLTAAGYWKPDIVWKRSDEFALPATMGKNYTAPYIQVTDKESNWTDASIAYDAHNEAVFVPVRYGTIIAAANIGGKPVSVRMTEDNVPALIIPDAVPKDALLTYWLTTAEPQIATPKAAHSITTASPVDTGAVGMVWERKGAAGGDAAAYIQQHGVYSLAPPPLVPKSGEQWSDTIERWVDNGMEANCQTSSTAVVVSEPALNIANGYINPGSNVLDTHHAHQWPIDKNGFVHDATPINEDAATAAYFNDSPVPRATQTFAQKLVSTLTQPGILGGEVGAGALIGGASIARRRRELLTRMRATQEARAERRDQRQLARQEKKVDRLPGREAQAGYRLLDAIRHGNTLPDVPRIVAAAAREHQERVRIEWLDGSITGARDVQQASALAIHKTYPRPERPWLHLTTRTDFTDGSVARRLLALSRLSQPRQSRRVVKAAENILRLAELQQSQAAKKPTIDTVSQ